MPNTKLTYSQITPSQTQCLQRESWASPNKYQFTANNNTETVSEALAIDTYIRYTNTKYEEMNNKSSEIATKLNSIATKLLLQVAKLISEHAKLISGLNSEHDKRRLLTNNKINSVFVSIRSVVAR